MRRPTSRRERVSAIVAIAIHVGASLLLTRPSRSVRAPDPSADGTPAPELAFVDLGGVLSPAPLAPTDAPGAVAERYVGSSSLGSSGPPVVEPAPVEPPAPGPSATSAPVMLVMPELVGIGVDGTNPFFARGALPDVPPVTGRPAPSDARNAAPIPPGKEETNRRATAALRESPTRKSEVGLGAEGPVLTALKDATYGGFTPEVGGALFVATIDDKGLVTALRLKSSWPATRDAHAGWEDARARAESALSGKKLPGRWLGADGAGSKGAELTIRVDSDMRLPSGARPKGILGATGEKGVITRSENTPGPALPSDQMQSFNAGTFDLTDIGAKPRRIVSTQVQSAVEL